MAMDYIPVADNPWVKVLEAIRAQIADDALSWHKFCVAIFGKAPKTFARYSTENNAAYWDPPLTDCPAVLITAINTPPLEDLGAGNEQWHLSFAMTVKAELRDRDQRKGLAANYELLRTLMHDFRNGPLNRIRAAGGASVVFIGDLTPQIAQAGAQTTAKTTFVMQVTLHHAFLG